MKYENSGLDLISMIEVIEHMYPNVLSACIESVFGRIRPKYVLITTPNREFNVVFEEHMDDADHHAEHNHNHDHREGHTQVVVDADGGLVAVMEKQPINGFRHWDHKFEWTRKEFETWCLNDVIGKYPHYSLLEPFSGLGQPPADLAAVGYCTQMAVFVRNDLEVKSSTKTESMKNNQLDLYIKVRIIRIVFLSFI